MTETFHAGPGLGRLSDVTIIHGDCIDAMAELEADSVDAIVTDPPYGLGFMGKAWDDLPPGVDWAKQCLRVLKPGGHLLAFGGTRTWHRLAVAVEDAGFEIRDSIAWLYGSGFPKSLDVSKAIDKAARGVPQGGADPTSPNHGNHRTTKTEGKRWDGDSGQGYGAGGSQFLATDGRASGSATAPAVSGVVETAAEWSGWGTALKPAFEPIVVARKPLGKGTVAANVLQHGTGALNIDGCRIAGVNPSIARRQGSTNHLDGGRPGAAAEHNASGRVVSRTSPERFAEARAGEQLGRWPANVVLDEHAASVLDQMSGTLTSGALRPYKEKHENASSFRLERDKTYTSEKDSGGASRFFYVAKAPKKERPTYVDADGKQHAHPTVKPLALMRWLVRLITPPGGVILDPFAGSGTTVEAALLEGFRVIGIERGGPEGTPESHYLAMIQQRIVRCLVT